MKEKRNDIYSSIVLIIFAIFLFVGSWWIPPTTSDILGSRFFPRVIAVVIGGLSFFQLVGAVSVVKNRKEKEEAAEKKEAFSISLLLTVVALFVYYILVLQIGFTITSILYLLFQSAVLMSKDDFKNRKKVIILVLVSIITPIFINVLFGQVFLIVLPEGNLFW